MNSSKTKALLGALIIMFGMGNTLAKSTPCSNVSKKQSCQGGICPCITCSHPKKYEPKKGVVQVATDKADNPVTIAYTVQGKQKPGIPTIVFADTYFGEAGWPCQQEALSKCCFTIAFDQVGSGKSSRNLPANLDGVGGYQGYSYSQYAFFIHQLLAALNVSGPIILVAVDTQGNAAIKYATTYASDPLALSKLVLINVGPQAVVSDDPCQLAYLTPAIAAEISAGFALNPCATLCGLLQSSFINPACPEASKAIYNAAVNFGASGTPAIFDRNITQTFTEDVSPELEKIKIRTLYLYSILDPNNLLARQAQGIVFTGYCPTCGNPGNPGTCNSHVGVKPIADCQFMTFAGKGTPVWLIDTERVNRAIKEFVFDCDLACCPCPKNLDIPVICPVCA